MLLALALPVSLAMGAIAALARAMLDHTPRHFDQLESATGVPVTSAIPRVSLRKLALKERGGLDPADRRHSIPGLAPPSLMLGAMRDLHAALVLHGGEQRQTILFTSSLPDEGKTSAAIAFARMLTCHGREVLFVDGDLRQPMAHQRLGFASRPGLGEYLAGVCRLDQAIQRDPLDRLSFLPAGGSFIDMADFGDEGSFARVLQWGKCHYDVVVIDSAPVLSAAESLLLARLADRTVFLVRWSRTPIDAAQRGLRLLADSGAKLAGVTLSMVGKSELAHYHYSGRYARIESARGGV